MTGRRQPADGPRVLDASEVSALWQTFRDGGTARCPRDAGPLALTVDGGAKTYRLVCTDCGSSSPWFEVKSQGLVLRNAEAVTLDGGTEELTGMEPPDSSTDEFWAGATQPPTPIEGTAVPDDNQEEAPGATRTPRS